MCTNEILVVPRTNDTCSDVCAKHAQQRRHVLQQHLKTNKRVVASAALPPAARTYEEQYAAVMGGAMPTARYSSQSDTDILPMHGQLESFPALPADAVPAVMTAAVPASRGSATSKLKDERDKEAWSFAKVIKTSGYFPELGSTVTARAPLPPPAWGRPAQAATVTHAPPAPAPAPSATSAAGAVLTFGSRRRR